MNKHSDNAFLQEDLNPEQLNKLQLWKNASYVEEEYFDKLKTCVQQRIRMNKEMQPMHLFQTKPQLTTNKKTIALLTILGLAAVFLLMFFLFQNPANVKTNSPSPSAQETSLDKKEVGLKDTTIILQNSNQKNSLCNIKQQKENIEHRNINWEVAIQEISDEELEDMIWDLEWEEAF
jgi:low affinity Fe/Cu permease